MSNPICETVFDTSPWPQFAESREAREGGEGRKTTSLPSLPSRDTEPALDNAVLTAYGFSGKKDLLPQLLALNQQVAANIENGSPVTAPGVPEFYPEPQKLVTEDCIQPTAL